MQEQIKIVEHQGSYDIHIADIVVHDVDLSIVTILRDKLTEVIKSNL